MFIVLGCVTFLFLIYYFFKSKEGFTSSDSPDTFLAKIKDANNELSDKLLISKYKTSYEDIIIALEEWTQLNMIQLLTTSKIGTSVDITSLQQFNELSDFKKKLNDSLKYIDSIKK